MRARLASRSIHSGLGLPGPVKPCIAEITVAEPRTAVATVAGRMRYRLPDGEYHLSLLGGPCVRFAVRDRCWTTVRLQLA